MVGPVAGQDPLAVLWRMVDANPAFAGHKLRGLIAEIEARMAAQVVEIIHQARFLALEAAWRGLRHLVDEAAADRDIKVRVLHLTRRELADDLFRPVLTSAPLLGFEQIPLIVPGEPELPLCPEILDVLSLVLIYFPNGEHGSGKGSVTEMVGFTRPNGNYLVAESLRRQ